MSRMGGGMRMGGGGGDRGGARPPYRGRDDGMPFTPRQKRFVDFRAHIAVHLSRRPYERDGRDRCSLPPHPLFARDVPLPRAASDRPEACATTCCIRSVTNRQGRHAINACAWTPEGRDDGRYLVTGSNAGAFTLWKGRSFKHVPGLTPFDSPIRVMTWMKDYTYLAVGDNGGMVSFFESSLKLGPKFVAHTGPVWAVSFAPTSNLFCTVSDGDQKLKIWNMTTYADLKPEREVDAGAVKCARWHPYFGLIATGARDGDVRLWDPRAIRKGSGFEGDVGVIGAGGGSIAKFNASTKGAVNTVEWNENGRWILTASQDNLIRLWDVRKLEKPLRKLRGHDCAVTSAQWHPHHRELFVSADYHGGMKFWLASLDAPIASVANSKFENGAGHESGVFAMAWHPMGHMLATGSNDNVTKFWVRPRPGDGTEYKGVEGSAGAATVRQTQARRPPPENYTCNACHIKGHWIQQWCVAARRCAREGWRGALRARASHPRLRPRLAPAPCARVSRRACLRDPPTHALARHLVRAAQRRIRTTRTGADRQARAAEGTSASGRRSSRRRRRTPWASVRSARSARDSAASGRCSQT